MAGLPVPSICASVTAGRPPRYPASGDHRRPAASTIAVGLVLMRATHDAGGRVVVLADGGWCQVDGGPTAPRVGCCTVVVTPTGASGPLSRWPPAWLAPWTRRPVTATSRICRR